MSRLFLASSFGELGNDVNQTIIWGFWVVVWGTGVIVQSSKAESEVQLLFLRLRKDWLCGSQWFIPVSAALIIYQLRVTLHRDQSCQIRTIETSTAAFPVLSNGIFPSATLWVKQELGNMELQNSSHNLRVKTPITNWRRWPAQRPTVGWHRLFFVDGWAFFQTCAFHQNWHTTFLFGSLPNF